MNDEYQKDINPHDHELGNPADAPDSAAWSRRKMLQTTGKTVAGGVLAMGMPGLLRAQGPAPVKIGMVFAKQGTWTVQGEQLASGVRMALDEVGGKILGHPVELVWYDEPNPQSAQQNMQKLIDEDKVVAVIGGSNSGTSLAMSSVAKRARIPYITPNAAAAAVTGKECTPYTFRTLTTTMVASRALAPALLAVGKKWFFLTANYAFGQDIYSSMSSLLKEAKGTEAGSDLAPLGTTDYSSFILKIRQAKPDVVVAGLPGGDLSTFLKQWAEMGMKGKIPIACPIIGDADLWSIGAAAATGYYGKPWHFSSPGNPAADKAFAKAYMDKHGKPASDKVWLGWFTMRALIASTRPNRSSRRPSPPGSKRPGSTMAARRPFTARGITRCCASAWCSRSRTRSPTSGTGWT
jgi:branched-chain amino acid transport system substrate-binding protein